MHLDKLHNGLRQNVFIHKVCGLHALTFIMQLIIQMKPFENYRTKGKKKFQQNISSGFSVFAYS